MTKRVSCGFNLRVRAGLDDNPTHCDQFMLCSNNRSLISADTMVWVVPDELDNLIQDATQAFWNPLGLASNLDKLLYACRAKNIPVTSLSPTCITVSEEAMAALIERFGPGYFDKVYREEDLLSDGWTLLGLDTVQLGGLHSGLKGIGYTEPTWSQFRRQFGSALNEVGLFRDETTASQFAKLRGLEIPSHAPFDVVGLLVHAPIIY